MSIISAPVLKGFTVNCIHAVGSAEEFVTMRKQSSFNTMTYLLKYTINKYEYSITYTF